MFPWYYYICYYIILCTNMFIFLLPIQSVCVDGRYSNSVCDDYNDDDGVQVID